MNTLRDNLNTEPARIGGLLQIALNSVLAALVILHAVALSPSQIAAILLAVNSVWGLGVAAFTRARTVTKQTLRKQSTGAKVADPGA